MKAELTEITGDLYDIASRLREIDPEYRLFYNGRLKRFEVYAGGALQIAAPYKELDCRLLRRAAETRRDNAERLIEEIEKNNAEVAAAALKRARDTLEARIWER